MKEGKAEQGKEAEGDAMGGIESQLVIGLAVLVLTWYFIGQQGKKTLLASLNPVHSLSSVFGQELSGGLVKPVKDTSGAFQQRAIDQDGGVISSLPQ
jgi:hypothetical protein